MNLTIYTDYLWEVSKARPRETDGKATRGQWSAIFVEKFRRKQKAE